MLRIISLLLIVTGIYIGINYKEPILEFLGQDSLDYVDDVLDDGKEILVNKIDEVQG